MARVAVDAMGGDKGPEAAIEGALAARDDGIETVIFGSADLDTRGLAHVSTTHVLGIARPSVRLLSIGEEPEKGNQLTLEAHQLLSASDLDFRGNAEGRDILEGAADVLVSDGFTGNVALKAVEGTIRTLLDSLREEITASTAGTVGGFLIRPAARPLRKRL